MLGHREVRHGRLGQRAVPVPGTGWNPDDVSLANDLNRVAPGLNAAGAGRDNQNMTEGMGVPAVRAPGSNVTDAPLACDGSRASNSISTWAGSPFGDFSAGTDSTGREPPRVMLKSLGEREVNYCVDRLQYM